MVPPPEPALPRARTGPGFEGAPVDLLRLARAQRWLIWCVLARAVVEVALLAGPPLSGSGLNPGVFGVLYGAVIAATGATVLVYGRAFGMDAFSAPVFAVLLSIPIIGIGLTTLLNADVNRVLRASGVRIGLLGVAGHERPKLLAGACASCGYDLRGLGGPGRLLVCPECGRKAVLDRFWTAEAVNSGNVQIRRAGRP